MRKVNKKGFLLCRSVPEDNRDKKQGVWGKFLIILFILKLRNTCTVPVRVPVHTGTSTGTGTVLVRAVPQTEKQKRCRLGVAFVPYHHQESSSYLIKDNLVGVQ